MKLPSILQTVGLTGVTAGVLILFGGGWALLTGGVSTVAAGVALELERRR